MNRVLLSLLLAGPVLLSGVVRAQTDDLLYQEEITVLSEGGGMDDSMREKLSRPIGEFELSERARAVLGAAGAETVGDVARIPEAELLGMREIDRSSFEEIESMLADLDLTLGMETAPLVDPRAVMARIERDFLGDAGRGIDEVETLTFLRRSDFWKYQTLHKSDIKFRVFTWPSAPHFKGRVNELSLRDQGYPQPYAFIENGDDMFQLNRRIVLAHEQHEEGSRLRHRGELFLFLAPWYLTRPGNRVEYVDRVEVETFEPQEYDETLGYLDYQPLRRRFDRFVVGIPEAFHEAVGDQAEVWWDLDRERLARLRFATTWRPEAYGGHSILLELGPTQEVDGFRFLREAYGLVPGTADRQERIRFEEVEVGADLDEGMLRRP